MVYKFGMYTAEQALMWNSIWRCFPPRGRAICPLSSSLDELPHESLPLWFWAPWMATFGAGSSRTCPSALCLTSAEGQHRWCSLELLTWSLKWQRVTSSPGSTWVPYITCSLTPVLKQSHSHMITCLLRLYVCPWEQPWLDISVLSPILHAV